MVIKWDIDSNTGFPGGTVVKNPPANAGDAGSIPGSGGSPGGGNGYPLQYSCLENSMDRGVWWATVHGVTELDTTEQLILSLSRIFGEPNELIQRSANFSYTGPDSKYFRHCGPCSPVATSLPCYHSVKTAVDDI